ncbi:MULTISPECIES: ComEC/Rec2 family competence protein [unclassified Oceanispirochaeta]|uniref:ComEC/Rec2 family competence protein n=1 Tax=unclassified Oceanispirochaeta TaxID=2635722 RepID=UPI000E08E769|nr:MULTISPECIES: ComEC/Rec2 family competence protein [unclassified Oceanispirochaeta]MBF9015700.1 ComEC/Rec2 family competence protein [Oceanispirochaeta sp. M2]NPD72165.1 ComEC/Rec2 family competence protein [Oceanispirochaeta sp. M1]RDG32264.1 ComEC/Rec2 family competence protein [Oceanispirochaeta sp. M1]
MNHHILRGISLFTALFYTVAQPFGLPFYFYFFPLLILGALSIASGKKGVLFFIILLIFLSFSHVIYLYRSRLYIPFPVEHCISIRGRLVQEPSWNSRGNLNFILEPGVIGSRTGAAGEGLGRISVSLPAERAFAPEVWVRGDSMRVSGKMVLYEDVPFFYGRSMDLYVVNRPQQFRRRLLAQVHRRAASVSDFSASLLPALVLGLKHPSQERSSRLFRETGTAHIIALSGFHSGLVALLLYGFFKLILGHRGGLVMAGLGLLFYLYLAGPKPSLFRSVLMYQILLLCKLNHRKADLRKILIASFLISALVFPESLHTLSARLSYLALWGILSSSSLIYNLLHPMGSKFLRAGLSASLAAQIWTIPLVLSCFAIWYPAGIAASLVLTPLVSCYMYTGILYLFIPDLWILTVLPVFLCRLLEKMLLYSASIFRRIPPLSLPEAGSGLFLFLLFPLLLGLIYRPGGFGGKRRSEPELRLYLRDQSAVEYDGAGPAETLGSEFPDKQGCQGEDSKAAGSTGE